MLHSLGPLGESAFESAGARYKAVRNGQHSAHVERHGILEAIQVLQLDSVFALTWHTSLT